MIGLRKNRGRLTEPLVRENGALRPASWDEALDVAAAGLPCNCATDTTRSFGMFSCSKASKLRSPCLGGTANRAPAAMLTDAGDDPLERELTLVSSDGLIAILGGGTPPEPPSTTPPQQGDAKLRLLRVGPVDPESLDDYRAHGGYDALRRAIELGPEGVIREVMDSGIVGRGGAAFPMGRKWDAVARQPRRPHYLICNADESEPGTFKDRVLMEGDPFAVVEAMTIAAYATGCEHGYLYVRGEYPLARDAHRARDRARPRARASSAPTSSARASPSTSRCARAPAPTSAARRPRSSARSRATAVSRATSRRSRSSRGSSPPDGGQQRRDARQRPADRARGRAGLRADRQREVHRTQALLRVGRRRDAGDLRGPVRDDAARVARPRRRGDAEPPGRAPRRRRRRLR